MEQLFEELCARAGRGIVPGLSRMNAALRELSEPHETFPCIHIAGTNGKGSTSAMVEAIARESGLKTGLYTSPHLSRFAERIRIGGRSIENQPFHDALRVALRAANAELTFFECLTVAAFLAFREAKVDLAIVEVGLGGRFDATNVIARPLVTAITTIGLDHTDLLGDTVAKIAFEKAGIVKPGCPVIVGHLPSEAEASVLAVVASVGAGPVWIVRPEISARRSDVAYQGEGRTLDVQGPDGLHVSAQLALRGDHQHANAAIATALAWRLQTTWPAIAKAIVPALWNVSWPGRYEKIHRHDRTFLFDGAHNDDGAFALRQTFQSENIPPSKTTLLYGALANKPFASMLSRLADLADRRVYTTPNGRAPAPLSDLVRIAPGETIAEPKAALEHATAITPPGETILVTGSLYLLGELRAYLLGHPTDPIVGL